MSNTHDTYLRALKDAAAALDALADKAFTDADGLNIEHIGYDAYNAKAHTDAVARHSGICAAVLEIYGLIEQHRAGAA